MFYSAQKLGCKIHLQMTPCFKQVNFTKMSMKYITSTDKVRGGRHCNTVLH